MFFRHPNSVPPGDLVRLAVFVTSVTLVYLSALSFGLLSLKWRSQGYQPTMLVSGARSVITLLACLGLLCILYGRFIEPLWLEVKHVRIRSDRLRPGTSLRIVHISDLHSGPWPRLENRVATAIAAQRPDLIVFTGDAVAKPSGIPAAQEFFATLSTIAPVYAVRGNQDYRLRQAAFSVQTLHTLEDNGSELTVRGNNVRIMGAAYGHDRALPALVRSESEGGLRILLYHSPDPVENIAALPGVDLYCAGHTHGGQVSLPLYGAIITMTKTGKKYEAGLYRVANTYLYVNRGLGMDAPRVRFLSRPEITVIDVEGQLKLSIDAATKAPLKSP